MIASGGLIDPSQFPADLGRVARPERLEGLRLVEGVALGNAVLHQLRIEVTRLVADDPDSEAARLEQAIASLRASVDELLLLPEIANGEHREVLEAYRMFAHDAGWRRSMREAIRTGLTAEAAVRRVQEETRLRMAQVADAYLKERLHDLDALADRLLVHLTGRSQLHDPAQLPDEFILVARSLGPAELIDYGRARLRGVVLEEGSPTAHVTIVARALDIPMVGRVRGAMSRIEPGDRVALDGDHGQIFVRPGEDVELAFARSLADRAERRRIYASLRDQPAVTLDGMRVGLHLNAAFLIDLAALETTARRRHRPLPHRARLHGPRQLPGRRRAVRALRQGARAGRRQAGGVPHPRRRQRQAPALLDLPVGGEPGHGLARDAHGAGPAGDPAHPAARPDPERHGRAARRDVPDGRRGRRDHRGQAGCWRWSSSGPSGAASCVPSRLRVGAMLEVPSLFWQLRALLPRIDFLSIGSNDLFQFLFACDRGNPELIDRYDVLSPPVLSFLRELVERCRAFDVQLSICGEMASRPLEAMVLLGLGVRTLSLTPADVGPVKTMLRSLRCGALTSYLGQLYDLPDHSLRVRLRHYALDHGVQLHI